ncbi:cytochrome c biogenesis protein CcsA [Uliginosibacterium sp. 31-16]|uniref:cytochrome C assembly family protein n=1 Tax=Uliginosibacterium sp. 31-16 TaxID=3068315 RepID=UPI00273CFE9B|nr:cytochrome c biogenesis protein CcsA [Uliginosibacterium sp. 31-16]MDP5240735.1 cytochrome c biogenesis protein CcsA [Uliginosibacterium sp. 31-16]
MGNILLYLLPASLYAALTIACIRKKTDRNALIHALLLSALVSHAWSLGNLLFAEDGLRFGFTAALSLTLWLAMLIYSLESLLTPLHRLLKHAAPIAGFSCLLPLAISGHPHSLPLANWAFKAHIVVAMLAYSLFTLAIFHALLLAAAEHNLHRAKLGEERDTPPLLILDSLLFRLTNTAFVFLTLTVGSGLFFSEQIFNKPLMLNHKAFFGIASWLLFATLLIGRKTLGWRGKTATHWLLAGFIALVLAYAGTRFVLEFLLGRSV